MKKYFQTILITAALGVVGANAEVDCVALAQTVTLEVSAEKSQVLEIVSKHVAAAPDCACEVVKSAIKASEADSKAVAAIVQAAISSAPEQTRLISQCAIATAPDAAADIQAVLAELDPNSGDSVASAKGAKAPAEVAEETWNPLDFPGPPEKDGPRPFPPGDGPLPPGPPFNNDPVSDTPVITPPDPSSN